mgnify:FL=1
MLDSLDLYAGLNKYDILTQDNLQKTFQLYEITDSVLIERWNSRIQSTYPVNKIHYIDLIMELESIGKLELSVENITKLFNLYRLNSVKRIEPSVEAR